MRHSPPSKESRRKRKKRPDQLEMERLRLKLEESEAILEAIRAGEIEALIVQSPGGEKIFSLQGSDHAYRMFVEVMSEGAVSLDTAGVILYCNKRFAEMIGARLEDAIGASFNSYIQPSERQDFSGWFRTLRNERGKRDFTLRRGDGSALPSRLAATPLQAGDSKSPVCMVVMDMTAQKQSEERLLTLSRRLIEAQEIERRHLARELHDEVGQLLTGLKIMLETASLIQQPLPEHSTAEARDQLSLLLKRMQDISLDLRPAMLDDLGLLPAILWHFQRYEAQTQIKVRLSHSGLKERRLPPQIETAAYRIIQEALTNIARHSGAESVQVEVTLAGDLRIRIEDAGAGFDLQKALASRNSTGLAGMQERAALLGGALELHSAKGRGTRIQARLPGGIGKEL